MDDLEAIKGQLKQIESALLAAIDQADDATSILELQDYLYCLSAKARQWQALIEQRFIEYIQSHGEVSDGRNRYYIATAKTIKAIDNVPLLETCLELAGGDVKTAAGFLAVGAFKYGAVRAALDAAGLGERFEELFATEEKIDLKTGQPVREIRASDT